MCVKLLCLGRQFSDLSAATLPMAVIGAHTYSARQHRVQILLVRRLRFRPGFVLFREALQLTYR